MPAPAMLDEFGLTERQRFILKFLVKFVVNNQRPPTLRELMEILRVKSPNGVRCHLNALHKKGFITIMEHHACGIQIKGLKLERTFQDSEDGKRLSQLFGEVQPLTPCAV